MYKNANLRVVAMVASLALPLLGQVDRATLTGRVIEASGAGIPEVSV